MIPLHLSLLDDCLEEYMSSSASTSSSAMSATLFMEQLHYRGLINCLEVSPDFDANAGIMVASV